MWCFWQHGCVVQYHLSLILLLRYQLTNAVETGKSLVCSTMSSWAQCGKLVPKDAHLQADSFRKQPQSESFNEHYIFALFIFLTWKKAFSGVKFCSEHRCIDAQIFNLKWLVFCLVLWEMLQKRVCSWDESPEFETFFTFSYSSLHHWQHRGLLLCCWISSHVRTRRKKKLIAPLSDSELHHQ